MTSAVHVFLFSSQHLNYEILSALSCQC